MPQPWSTLAPLALGVVVLFGALDPALSDERREHGAHEHGTATMTVVLEAGTLLVTLNSPGMNLVGFEHEPRTDEQRKLVSAALERLRQGDAIVLPVAAGCTLSEAQAKVSAMEENHDEDHGDGGHESDHEESHEESKTGHEDHDADHEDAEPGRHNEFEAAWSFACASPDNLDWIDARLFELFPATRVLRAQVVTSSMQTVVELDPNATRLELSP